MQFNKIEQLLPPDCIQEIVSFLDVTTLCALCLCSKSLGKMARQDWIWKNLCAKEWQDKQNHSMKHRESALVALAKPWKQIFADALQDAKREHITKDELCTIKWEFYFNHSDMPIYPQFHGNFTYSHDGLPNMTWRFASNHNVQVEQYPELKVTRLPNWGWQLQNQYVLFHSMANEDFGRAQEERDKQKQEVLALAQAMGLNPNQINSTQFLAIQMALLNQINHANAADMMDSDDEDQDENEDNDEYVEMMDSDDENNVYAVFHNADDNEDDN